MKRLLYAFGIVALVVVIVLLGYFLRPKPDVNLLSSDLNAYDQNSLPPDSNDVGSPDGTQNSSSTEVAPIGSSLEDVTDAEVRFGPVAQHEVADFHPLTSTDVLVLKKDGSIIEINSEQETVLSGAPIASLIRSSFSFDGSYILAVIGNQTGEQLSIFDVKNKSWTLLPETAYGGVWAPTANTLAFFENGTAGVQIVTWTPTKPITSRTTLLSINALDVQLAWPAPTKMILSDRPSSEIAGSIFMIDTTSKTLSPVAQEENGLMGLWSPKGDAGVVLNTYPQTKGGRLTLRDNRGTVKARFDFLTVPPKCAFIPSFAVGTTTSSTAASIQPYSLACGVPYSREFAQASMPDAYLMGEAYTDDALYDIDIDNGNIILLPIPYDVEMDIVNIQENGDVVFFVNRLDNKLYFVKRPY